MKIETLEIAGFRSVLEALRLPFNKEARSVTRFNLSEESTVGAERRGQWAWWLSAETSVCADPRDLRLMETLVRRGDEHAKAVRGIVVYAKITAPVYWWCELETYRAGHERLSSESTMHGVAKGLTGDELVRVKSELPMGTELAKVDMFSYQALRRIAVQRRGHRLPEWAEFIAWMRSLPLSRELIFAGMD